MAKVSGHTQTLLDRHGAACMWCSRKLTAGHPALQLDRLITLADPNIHRVNYVPACVRCTAERDGRPASDWVTDARSRGFQVRVDALMGALLDLLEVMPRNRRDLARDQLVGLGVDYQRLSDGALRRDRRVRELMARDGDRGCFWCGVELEPYLATYDHVLPQSQDGPNDLSNLVAACFACNNRRGDLDVADWVAELRAAGVELSEEKVMFMLDTLSRSSAPQAVRYANEQMARLSVSPILA